MDTHDEEFGPLIRKQIQADKEAKEKRDNTYAQGEGPSKPQTPHSYDKLQWPSESSIKHRLWYIIEMLESDLRKECMCKYDADNFLQDPNFGGYYYKSTKAAFEESRRLAIERITQLEIALNFFKQA